MKYAFMTRDDQQPLVYSYCILKEPKYSKQIRLKKESYMALLQVFFGAALLHCINFQLRGGVHLVLV